MDISSDLTALGSIAIAVISAGVKSILDIPRTLEFLVNTLLFWITAKNKACICNFCGL